MDVRYGVALALVVVVGVALHSASAAPAPGTPRPAITLEWHLGDDFVAAYNPDGAPAVAVSGDGERIEVSAMGDINVTAGTASGEGRYLRSDSAGNVVESGRIVVDGLIVFSSFGNGTAEGLPGALEGGSAAMRVHLEPRAGGESATGVLRVECALGKVPPGQNDPIRLSVKGGPNYNRSVHGAALFIAVE